MPVGGRRLLGGFVSFLRRPDAEKACKELDGAEWGGSVLRTGWGKAVPTPARAIYGESISLVPSTRRELTLLAEIEGASHRSDRDRDRSSGRFGRGSSPHGRADANRRRSPSSRSRSRSRSPPRRAWPKLEEGVDDKFLRSVSARIREHGDGFLRMIEEKEAANPNFAFLRDEKVRS